MNAYATPPSPPKHILLVEDMPDIQELLKLLLETEGYSISCAFNGKEALDRIRSSALPRPHLILLDLTMPIMDGYEFIQEQSQDPELASIPVILMTAVSDSVEKLSRLKVKGVIKKPIDMDHCLQTLSDACSQGIQF